MSFSQIFNRITKIAQSYKSNYTNYEHDAKAAEEFIQEYNKIKKDALELEFEKLDSAQKLNAKHKINIGDEQDDIAYQERINSFRILELHENSSNNEIVIAFRKQLKKFHPDNFTNESEEVQKQANMRVIELIKAYEYLLKK